MRKNALTLTCTACVFGAFGVFCRWIQGMSAFEENGLYKSGNVWGIILIAMYLAAAASLFGFALYFKRREKLASPPELGLAIAGNTRLGLPVAAVMALAMAGGSVMLLVTAGGEEFAKLLRLLALLGLACAAGFMGMAGSMNRPSPRGSALEVGLCLASALPVAFCCFWLVVSYRQDAATSVVWSYAPEIIALAVLAPRPLLYGRPRLRPPEALRGRLPVRIRRLLLLRDPAGRAALRAAGHVLRPRRHAALLRPAHNAQPAPGGGDRRALPRRAGVRGPRRAPRARRARGEPRSRTWAATPEGRSATSR